MFNKIIKGATKREEGKKEKIVKVMNQMLDIAKFNNISLAEMSDVIANIQVSYNRMLLDEIAKLQTK